MIKVYRSSKYGDWEMSCTVHGDKTICEFWRDALEAAYGHACMYHSPRRPVWTVTVDDGSFTMSVVDTPKRVQ